MTYFQRNPQRTPQWNPRRRNGHTDSGVVVVHTFEAPASRTCTWGANFLRTRTDYGSYHWLADALGYTRHLAPWSAETWHETTVNNWSVGISMMAYAANWRKITPAQRRNLIHGAALGAHRYSRWRVSQGKSAVPARRITRAQALRGVPGFIGHGEIDTARRTDPGPHFPWNDFLAEYTRLEAGAQMEVKPTTPTAPEEFDMSQAQYDAIKSDLNKIKTALEETQANSRHLPPIRDRVTKTNHAAGRSEIVLAQIARQVGSPVDTAELAAALAEHLDIETALTEALAELPDRDNSEIAAAVVSKIANRLQED